MHKGAQAEFDELQKKIGELEPGNTAFDQLEANIIYYAKHTKKNIMQSQVSQALEDLNNAKQMLPDKRNRQKTALPDEVSLRIQKNVDDLQEDYDKIEGAFGTLLKGIISEKWGSGARESDWSQRKGCLLRVAC